MQGDITSWADIKRMAQWAFDEQGGVDVLVNNVGDMASGQASWTEVTEEAIDHVLAVDIKGTKSYAKALAPTVRVNTFAPGFMETEAVLARPEWKTGRREQILGATPAGRIPGPEDMTGAALFLASADAHHVTGSYMIADGGYSMLGA